MRNHSFINPTQVDETLMGGGGVNKKAYWDPPQVPKSICPLLSF